MKALTKLTLALFSIAAFQSCDKVDAPYKEEVQVIAGERKVLVEDYTGHKCGNCPRASKSLYDLKAIYGDRLVIMAVHAGGFATVFPPSAPYYTYDFRTPEGTELDTDFGISAAGNPNGMVNRRQVNGNYILSSTSWAGEVASVLNDATPVPVKITINNSFDAPTKVLQTEVKTEISSSLQGSYKLCVFMVEDSIINWQKDYDASPEDIEFYVHREVLRGSMNGTYGVDVNGLNQGDIDTKNYIKVLGTDWDANHMSVIAYLYNATTKEIVQVEQKEIIE